MWSGRVALRDQWASRSPSRSAPFETLSVIRLITHASSTHMDVRGNERLRGFGTFLRRTSLVRSWLGLQSSTTTRATHLGWADFLARDTPSTKRARGSSALSRSRPTRPTAHARTSFVVASARPLSTRRTRDVEARAVDSLAVEAPGRTLERSATSPARAAHLGWAEFRFHHDSKRQSHQPDPNRARNNEAHGSSATALSGPERATSTH